MTPEEFLRTVYRPAAARASSLLPARVSWSPAAHQMLMTIAGQESAWTHRRQINGPARGFWQFERGGGVRGVMQHHSSAAHAQALCTGLNVPFEANAIYVGLENNDALAVGFARLLLFTDAAALPTLAQMGWDYYNRNWRPGRPHPEMWQTRWDAAAQALRTG